MKTNNLKVIGKIAFYLLAIVLFVIVATFLYRDIIYPSYISVSVSCHPISFKEGIKEASNKGYEVVGFYDSNTTQITFFRDYNLMDLKHENVHRVQDIEGRSGDCSNLGLMYINEIEAYWNQKLPYFLYKLRYGEVSYPN